MKDKLMSVYYIYYLSREMEDYIYRYISILYRL